MRKKPRKTRPHQRGNKPLRRYRDYSKIAQALGLKKTVMEMVRDGDIPADMIKPAWIDVQRDTVCKRPGHLGGADRRHVNQVKSMAGRTPLRRAAMALQGEKFRANCRLIGLSIQNKRGSRNGYNSPALRRLLEKQRTKAKAEAKKIVDYMIGTKMINKDDLGIDALRYATQVMRGDNSYSVDQKLKACGYILNFTLPKPEIKQEITIERGSSFLDAILEKAENARISHEKASEEGDPGDPDTDEG